MVGRLWKSSMKNLTPKIVKLFSLLYVVFVVQSPSRVWLCDFMDSSIPAMPYVYVIYYIYVIFIEG